MKYVFFGTPEFAAVILEKLIKAGFMPEAVVCNPDKPVGRKKIITPPAVKSLIMNHEAWNIPVLQPEKLDRNFILYVSSFKLDVFVVAAYSQILPKEILEIPRLGTIGVHPSLLPKYRGSSPIQAAILNGNKETGVTLFLMDEKVDHGPIIRNEKLEMRNEDYESLSKKLAEMGGDLLIETLPKFIKAEIKLVPQDESQATYTKKFKTEDAYVDLAALQLAMQDEPRPDGREKAIEIDRKIRALNPEPGVWTILNNKRTKLLEAKIIDGSTSLTINPEQRRRIDGQLKITKIQVEGKKPKNFCGIV